MKSQYNLANLYNRKGNEKEAKYWYQKAKELGSKEAGIELVKLEKR